VSEFSNDFSTEPQKAKARLRAELLAARHTTPPTSPSTAEMESVRATLADLAQGVPTVACYVPLPGEPGGPGLPDALAEVCGTLLLPVLLPDLDLDWAAYDGTLVPGARGLREPAGTRLGRAAIATAHLCIVPALAVDLRGVRLGRGGGSYDRALARVPAGVRTVAVVYDRELLVRLPEQPHDRRVRAVVTPSAGLRLLPNPAQDPHNSNPAAGAPVTAPSTG
jgi:5-formyltetrahydrofolate cyclo-ligase